MSNISIAQMVASSSAESRILLYSARRALSGPEKERLCLLLRNPIDWDYLCASATAHGSMPLLFRSLNSLPKSMVPGPQLRDLGRHFVSNAVRSRKLARELFRILDLLAGRGIVAVPYKGPALAAAAYGDLTLRISGDLDILIPQKHVRSAMHLLLADGFRCHNKAIGSGRLDLRGQYHLELSHPADKPPLEVHWKFSDDLDFPIDLDEWFGRVESQQLAGQLLAERIVWITAEPPQPSTPLIEKPTSPYHPPELNIYTDMEDLLALDPPLPTAIDAVQPPQDLHIGDVDWTKPN